MTSGSGEKIPARKSPYEYKDNAAKDKSDANSREHGLLGALRIAGTDILRDKGGHGLHQCAWNQHGKIHDFAGDTVTGRSREAQSVDKGTVRSRLQGREA